MTEGTETCACGASITAGYASLYRFGREHTVCRIAWAASQPLDAPSPSEGEK